MMAPFSKSTRLKIGDVFTVVPQPVYMNASELRQQQQQQQWQENGQEDGGAHAIYSSLGSCNAFDDGQGNDDEEDLGSFWFFVFALHFFGFVYIFCFCE